MGESRPLWLEGPAGPVFAVLHPRDPRTEPAAPVLIVPPWGWHEVASYRSRRTWAEHLAERGHPTLRLDLPGTGDSAGDAGTPDLVAAWIEAVRGAASWLSAMSGGSPVSLVGLGLGGLVALHAIARGAPVGGAVLWATASSGREEVRRLRAFARLQPDRYALGEPEPVVLPEGSLEVNGFVLSAATVEAIEALGLPGLAGTLDRALLLDADGLPAPARLADDLRGAGVDVAEADGPGWAAMTFHPQHDEPPRGVFATVDDWLAGGRGVHGAPPPASMAVDPVTCLDARIAVHGGFVREAALAVDTPSGRLFGVLAEPDAARLAGVAAIFLNAGAVRRIGPNRIWVETARRWAALGVPTLRIDLDGIGDSEGDSTRYRDVGQFYERDDLAAEIRAFGDVLLGRTGAERLILAGLCAGGYWAYHGADRDERVAAAYLLNPGALFWTTDLVRRRDARRLRRLADPAWWRRLARGQVRAERIRRIAGAAASEGLGRLTGRRRLAGDPPGSAVDRRPLAILDRLTDRGTSLVVAFSNDESLYEELRADGVIDRIAAAPNARLERLPGRDHTLRPAIAQRAAHELLDRSMLADLSRLGIRPDEGAA
jgi:alpha-beta hydrolase superfamily lysophospholipase